MLEKSATEREVGYWKMKEQLRDISKVKIKAKKFLKVGVVCQDDVECVDGEEGEKVNTPSSKDDGF